MKVYKIDHDVSKYRALCNLEDDKGSTPSITLDGSSLRDNWSEISLYSLHPKRPSPDFWHLWHISGGTAVAGALSNNVLEIIQQSAELLPLKYDNVELKLVNIVECIDVLNIDQCIWKPNLRLIGEPLRYVFHANRFTENSLFKIPETCRSSFYALERDGDPISEFKASVEAHKLKGLKFTEIWSS